ncbi:MAG: DUF3048 domain-containing protein [Lachnospiraceae bacterium]|nr:DUF3048 domain-containing protein [Lachnospiraceae bacterium]
MIKWKKKLFAALLSGAMAVTLLLSGCSKGDASETGAEISESDGSVTDDTEKDTESILNWQPIPTSEPSEESSEGAGEETAEEETREGMYRSELTNEWIDVSLQDQRPIAVMVDNESFALPHYGVNSADVVYELMNSTANGRITRLMVLVKDWANIERLGSVRSTRPTNFMLAAEWNAILCHDGGPFYNDEYIARPYTNNLSGGFARFSNGKATEYTEYITAESYTNENKGKTYPGLIQRIEEAGYSKTYNDYYPGPHFQFAAGELDLSGETNVQPATEIAFPFPHNSSKLSYNETAGEYEYYEYGEAHTDPLDGDAITGFKNVIIQSCSFTQYDENGYLIYHVVGSGEDGYYLTNGQAIPITWSKADETAVTVYKNKATGEEIELNTGKTYIAIVPSDAWGELVIQ